MIDWTEIKGERSRTYHFPSGDVATFTNVVKIRVSESGGHRLEMGDGKKAYVIPSWLWIDIDAEGWSL